MALDGPIRLTLSEFFFSHFFSLPHLDTELSFISSFLIGIYFMLNVLFFFFFFIQAISYFRETDTAVK